MQELGGEQCRNSARRDRFARLERLKVRYRLGQSTHLGEAQPGRQTYSFSPDAGLPPPLPVDVGAASTEGEVKSRGAAEPGMFDKMMSSPAFKSAMRSAGTVIGREITRSIFGTGTRRR